MKVTAYVRVGHNKKAKNARARSVRVMASNRPTDEPLYDSKGYPIPTVSFAVELDLPDAMFERAEEVIAKLTVPESQVRIAAKVRQPPD